MHALRLPFHCLDEPVIVKTVKGEETSPLLYATYKPSDNFLRPSVHHTSWETQVLEPSQRMLQASFTTVGIFLPLLSHLAGPPAGAPNSFRQIKVIRHCGVAWHSDSRKTIDQRGHLVVPYAPPWSGTEGCTYHRCHHHGNLYDS